MSRYEHHQSHFNLRKFLLGFFILPKQWDPNFLLLCISFLLCMDLQPYSHDSFSKIFRTLFDFRNNTYWVSLFYFSTFWPQLKHEFSIIWYNFYTMPTLEFVADIPISHWTRQIDWPPQLHRLPIGCAHLPWWTFQIGLIMSIWRDAAPTLLLAPGSPNQSHMLSALSSFCCRGPAAL